MRDNIEIIWQKSESYSDMITPLELNQDRIAGMISAFHYRDKMGRNSASQKQLYC